MGTQKMAKGIMERSSSFEEVTFTQILGKTQVQILRYVTHSSSSDHPTDGEWNEMVYYLDAACGSGSSSISLTLRDHASVSALQRTWGPGAEEYGTLGTIPYPSEEYTLTLTFTGDSDLD